MGRPVASERYDAVCDIAYDAARRAIADPAEYVAQGFETLREVAEASLAEAGFDVQDDDVWEAVDDVVAHVVDIEEQRHDPDSELNKRRGRHIASAVAPPDHGRNRVHAAPPRRYGARRRGAGRPARSRTTRRPRVSASRCSPDDLGDEPPGHRLLSREGAAA